MQKVIILDGGFYTHKSIFAYIAGYKKEIEKVCYELKPAYNKELDNDIFIEAKGIVEEKIFNKKLWISSSDYTYFQMIISDLKKIGVNKNDIVIVALDGRNSWRKCFLPSYKANRKKLRDAQTDIINWGDEYEKIEKMNNDLNNSTNWNFIKFNLIYDFIDIYFTNEGQKFNINQHKDLFIDSQFSCEADDIQAYAVRYFNDREVILVTIDEDLDQLYYYQNCKIFNPNTKSVTNKSKKGFYNIVVNPLGIIKKKVKSGDVSDNILVDKKKDTQHNMEIRQLIIYLLTLPEFIERPIKEVFDNLNYNKKVTYTDLPYYNSLGKRFDSIYEMKNIRTIKESIKNFTLKKEKQDEKNRLAYQNHKRKLKLKKRKV